jgi:hypothetical protein
LLGSADIEVWGVRKIYETREEGEIKVRLVQDVRGLGFLRLVWQKNLNVDKIKDYWGILEKLHNIWRHDIRPNDTTLQQFCLCYSSE